MRKSLFCTFITLLHFNLSYAETQFLPSNILMMDDNFTHHLMLVEKSTHTIYLYQNEQSGPKLVKTFKAATGKKMGNKLIEGDKKTPEGIYQLNEFYSDKDLQRRYGDYAKMYGAGAFTTNYPNPIDRIKGKSGTGIWLHSTDDDTRVDKGLDSRGCVVVVGSDLKDLSRYIDLKHTPFVIVQDLRFLNKKTWEKNRDDILEVVMNWTQAWKEKQFDQYISHYDKEHFRDRTKGNYYGFRNYKKAVFSNIDEWKINFSDISILMHNDYAVVQMKQDYTSSVVQDIGKKTLYLKKDKDYHWKIVTELWSKVEENRNLAFTPSMRFFQDSKEDRNI